MRAYRSPSLDKIVGKHLQLWEIRKEVRHRRAEEERGEDGAVGPYIAISRLPGSRGDEVGRRCAELLGWELFDREIVDHIARDARTLNKFVTSLDERCRKSMDDWIQTALDTQSLGHMAYLRHLKRVLMTIALHGNAVILGRGANFVLPSEAGLRILVTAPNAWRAANLAREKGLTAREASRELLNLDSQRAEFLRTHFLGAALELDHHDLIINMATMTPEQAATVIVDSFYTLDRRPLVRAVG